MRLIRSFVGLTVLAVAFNGCFEAPHFPDTPEITFNDIVFKEVADPSKADTLIVTVNFKDGDGDLGLDDGETQEPYNDKFYYVFPNGDYVNYATKRTVPGFDTLPELGCNNWEEVRDQSGNVADTLYFTLNPDHYNFFVDFYVQQHINGKDSMVYFDWTKQFEFPNCSYGFNGRFPILSKDLSQKNAQEGKIRYAMKSVGFNVYFSVKVLQLKIHIQDRALHKSNVIATDKFTLPGIRK